MTPPKVGFLRPDKVVGPQKMLQIVWLQKHQREHGTCDKKILKNASLRNPTFGGVIILKLFDLSFGFGDTGGKIANFWHIQP